MARKVHSCGIGVVIQLAAAWVAVAQTGADLLTTSQAVVIVAKNNHVPIAAKAGTSSAITISARTLDFGSVYVGSIRQLSFTVQNAGAGIFTAMASVSPPFSIFAGGLCELKPLQTQVITIEYAPRSPGMHMTVVRLTGAEGGAVTVMGSAVSPLHRAPVREPRAPAEPSSPRLIVRQSEAGVARARGSEAGARPVACRNTRRNCF